MVIEDVLDALSARLMQSNTFSLTPRQLAGIVSDVAISIRAERARRDAAVTTEAAP